MPFLDYKHVKITGFAAGVPKKVCSNSADAIRSSDYDADAFVKTTGVKERRYDADLCTSDLCVPATEKLIADLQWDKKDIDGLLFVTQNPDYRIPATSCIIQDRLGLSKDCFAEDIALGCSGWVYGLATACGLISGGAKKVLLLCGDARHNIPEDKPDPLFGYAGTATAIEACEGEEGISFHFGTDGSGYDAIIVPDGGARNQISDKSFVAEDVDGQMICPLQGRMKGMDVFSFGITTAPKSVKALAKHLDEDYLSNDYFVFHQANKMMNDMIAKKLKLPQEKVPMSLEHFGNTSSATIPLTIVTQLSDNINKGGAVDLLCCGFGVGLSWGSVKFTANNLHISELVEV